MKYTYYNKFLPQSLYSGETHPQTPTQFYDDPFDHKPLETQNYNSKNENYDQTPLVKEVARFDRDIREIIATPSVERFEFKQNTQTINHLKNQLGLGMGLRTNKYLLVIPTKNPQIGSKLNILCQNVTLPQRSLSPIKIHRFGREYRIRSEVQFQDNITITFIDDSYGSIRSFFERWMVRVDDSKSQHIGFLEELTTNNNVVNKNHPFYDFIDTQEKYNHILDELEFRDSMDLYLNFNLSGYQLQEIYIYQLDQKGRIVYGYRFQNVFISEIGSIDLGDSIENTMNTFNVTLTFSEFEYLNHREHPFFEKALYTKFNHEIDGDRTSNYNALKHRIDVANMDGRDIERFFEDSMVKYKTKNNLSTLYVNEEIRE